MDNIEARERGGDDEERNKRYGNKYRVRGFMCSSPNIIRVLKFRMRRIRDMVR